MPPVFGWLRAASGLEEAELLRRAVEQSRNVPAVKTLQAVGLDTGIEYAKRLGLSGELPPYLPLALGAGEATLQETVTMLKRDHRRYAKRQLTWFNADSSVHWMTPKQPDEALERIDRFLSQP